VIALVAPVFGFAVSAGAVAANVVPNNRANRARCLTPQRHGQATIADLQRTENPELHATPRC
jgi:hypothetical protein